MVQMSKFITLVDVFYLLMYLSLFLEQLLFVKQRAVKTDRKDWETDKVD